MPIILDELISRIPTAVELFSLFNKLNSFFAHMAHVFSGTVIGLWQCVAMLEYLAAELE